MRRIKKKGKEGDGAQSGNESGRKIIHFPAAFVYYLSYLIHFLALGF